MLLECVGDGVDPDCLLSADAEAHAALAGSAHLRFEGQRHLILAFEGAEDEVARAAASALASGAASGARASEIEPERLGVMADAPDPRPLAPPTSLEATVLEAMAG